MGIAALKQANTNRARFNLLKEQTQRSQELEDVAMDTIKAADMNKLNMENTKNRLGGASTMKQLRGIAALPKDRRSGPLSDLKKQMASRGVSITDTVMQTFSKLESEELIPLVNQMSAGLMASGGGQNEILDTITNVDKSIAALENAHFSSMNPEAAKKQQIENIDKQIQARRQAMVNLIGQPQSAAIVKGSIDQLQIQRDQLTGANDKVVNVAAGSQLVNANTGEVIHSTPRQSKLLTNAELAQKMQIAEAGSTKIDLMDKPPTINEMPLLVGPKGEAPKLGETKRELQEKGFRVRSEADKKREQLAASVQATLDKLSALADPVFTGESGVTNRIWDDAKNQWNRLGQTDKNLVLYEAFANGTVAALVRAVGEKGALSNKDIERGIKLIPSAGDGMFQLPDTREVALEKLESLREWFDTYLGDGTGSKGTSAGSLSDEELLEGF